MLCPDMYTLSPRACGPQASGVNIRQSTRACVTTIKCILMNSFDLRCKDVSYIWVAIGD